jgi:hypothetical protein
MLQSRAEIMLDRRSHPLGLDRSGPAVDGEREFRFCHGFRFRPESYRPQIPILLPLKILIVLLILPADDVPAKD